MQFLSEAFIVLAYIAAIGFLIFGIDDLIFDLHFIKHLRRTRNERHTTIEQLRTKPEQLIAIFVPAWAEGGVVNRMADYAVKILEYERYDIFIGVYPNDQETIDCVDALTRKCPRIHKAMCLNPGPTSKADCLNAIYHTMRQREIPGEREYSIIALHDSEDVLHPLTLKIYNYYVPDKFDMGQIPVFPLELPPLKHWVANTYMDDFSELHLKDMFARQEMGGVVPSAGVGTAFNREAIDYLADDNDGEPFVVGNLTEDYFIGIQLKRAGFREGFINYPIDRVVTKKDAEGNTVSRKLVTEIVAVRENFPRTFWTAVRQRSRWILGISMQCWELAGWSGTVPERYTLARDRRAPFVHLINALGYVVIFSWLGEMIFRRLPFVNTDYWRPLYTLDSLLWSIILVDTCFLIYRLIIKAYFVSEIYNWKQGLFAIPRYPLGNVINFFATCRAFWMYVKSRVFGKELVWLKTTHIFPTMGDLTEFASSIEDLLLQDDRIPRERIEQLINSGGDKSIPHTLLELRLMDEEQFTALWSRFSGLPEKTVLEMDADPQLCEIVPEDICVANRMVPVRPTGEDRVEVACLEPPPPAGQEQVESRTGQLLNPCLITPTNLRILRDRLYSTLAMPRMRPAFADTVEGLSEERAREIASIQFRTGNRFSDLLFDRGLLSADECRAVWCRLLNAEPCHMTDEKLDEEAYMALGPLFCYLHRLAPLQGDKLVFQEVLHPSVTAVIEERLGRPLRPVTDRAQPVRNFLRSTFASLNPEEWLLSVLVERDELHPEHAATLRSLKTLLRDPVHVLAERFGWSSRESLYRAFADLAYLPPPDERCHGPVPEGVLRPDFEARTGATVLEATEGCVTIGLKSMLPQQDFSQICTRLMRCGVRFVLAPLDP